LVSARADARIGDETALRAMRARGTDAAQAGRTGWRLRGLAFVAVTKAADFRNDDDRPCGGRRDWSEIWRVLLEPQMGPASMIVLTVDREDAWQMRPIEDDHVIQAFTTD